MKSNIRFGIMLACCLVAIGWAVQAEEGGDSIVPEIIVIPINTTSVQWNISDRVVGLHQVYGFVPDSVYADGQIAAWARRSGIATSRYPGGTVVKFWDWENPSGDPFGYDNHHPDFDPENNVVESEWMSLDEYLDFVDASGIHPHFGVNMASASHPGPDRHYPLISEADSIARAVRMVNYVKERGHGGAWWYLGNEEVHWHGGIAEYAKACRRYAEAMKAADPDIKLFWNDNGASKAGVRAFLSNDGGLMDGLETHGKWPYGGSVNRGVYTLSDWQNDFPLQDYRNAPNDTRKWRFTADQYRQAAEEVGRTILVANNEYGFGRAEHFSGFTRYTKGLLMTEFLMEMFQGNWDMSCFWDMYRRDRSEDGLLDSIDDDYRFNPFHFGMNMLADAHGGEFLARIPAPAAVSEDPTLQGFAARKGGVLLVYLLNKSDTTRSVELQLQGASYPAVFARRMQDSADGYGEMVSVAVEGEGTSFTCDLPPFTFTQFAFAAEFPGILHLRWPWKSKCGDV